MGMAISIITERIYLMVYIHLKIKNLYRCLYVFGMHSAGAWNSVLHHAGAYSGGFSGEIPA